MILHSAAAPPFMKNGFLVACARTREAVYIDPGDEVDDLLAVAARETLAVRHILLTHAHVDHVSGVARAVRALGVPVWLHHDDLFLYERAVSHGLIFGMRVEAPTPVDTWFEARGAAAAPEVTIGDLGVHVAHTPGHCPGGVCLAVKPLAVMPDPSGAAWDLFVGDTLFAGSIGRTDLPGGNYETLMRSIEGVLLPFGDQARVHSGHGADTTIGRERQTNAFVTEWLAR